MLVYVWWNVYLEKWGKSFNEWLHFALAIFLCYCLSSLSGLVKARLENKNPQELRLESLMWYRFKPRLGANRTRCGIDSIYFYGYERRCWCERLWERNESRRKHCIKRHEDKSADSLSHKQQLRWGGQKSLKKAS